MRKMFLFIFILPLFIKCTNGADHFEESKNESDTAVKDPSFGELHNKMINKMMSQVAMCDIVYNNKAPADSQLYEKGLGFILNGQYFVTCYHIYKATSNLKVKSVMVYYNLHWGNKEYDSVPAYLPSKPQADQYDFSKHIYDSTHRETDIIILKLAHKVNSTIPSMAKYSPESLETLYSFGLLANEGSVAFESATFLLNYRVDKEGMPFSLYIGNIIKGSSGCPVFDSKGEIIGINVAGWGSPNDLFQNFGSRIEKQKSLILNKYAAGLVATTSMSILYIKAKFGRGYF